MSYLSFTPHCSHQWQNFWGRDSTLTIVERSTNILFMTKLKEDVESIGNSSFSTF